MYAMATIIFLTGIISGAAWGIGYTDSVLHVAMAAAVGGFAGSVAAAACFTAMYLFSSKEEESSDDPAKEVEGELNQLKNKRKKQIL